MRTSALFGAKKNFGFFEIYDVSAWTRGEKGLSQGDILRTRGSIFRDFVRMSFINGLVTYPKLVSAPPLLGFCEVFSNGQSL